MPTEQTASIPNPTAIPTTSIPTPQPQVPLVAPAAPPKKNFLLPIIITVVLILIVVGGFLVFKSLPKQSPQASQSTTETAEANCTDGLEGNKGDNFCSNYHEPSSKCLPRSESIYPDGCSKL
jgi:hypothetical protein